jgi:excisionase family DNA binding protein
VPQLGDELDAVGHFEGRSMSLAQAGSVLQVSRRTVYYLIKGGRLRTLRTQMGSQRVLMDSLKSCWLARV